MSGDEKSPNDGSKNQGCVPVIIAFIFVYGVYKTLELLIETGILR